ncbi:hypothetical protein ACLKMH_15080 [Psychromonas sp. KJ10-10]|uniref:hypothetical protein n=1 Tax=Psychromonas sp. KJ10-10 TaxID=3391823 RepID=UPI0039B5570D
MTSITTSNHNVNQNASSSAVTPASAEPKQTTVVAKTVESPKSGLTPEGEKLITALNEVDEAGQEMIDGDKSVGDHIESFTYGALGIDHPTEIEKSTDDSYSAGQYLKGALTVGGLLLAIV